MMLFWDSQIKFNSDLTNRILFTSKKFWSAKGIQDNFIKFGHRLLLSYINYSLNSLSVEQAYKNYLTNCNCHDIESGAIQFVSLIINTDKRNIEMDVQVALRMLGETILSVGSNQQSFPFEAKKYQSPTMDNQVYDTKYIRVDSTSNEFLQKLAEQPDEHVDGSLEPYVNPELTFYNYLTGRSGSVEISELIYPNRRYLITARPLGGKTRLLREITTRRKHYNVILSINLADFATAGIPDIYAYAARTYIRLLELSPTRQMALRNWIEMGDLNGQILWMLDSWDGISDEKYGFISTAINPLNSFLLATTNQQNAKYWLQPQPTANYDTCALHGQIAIKPFTDEQIKMYISMRNEAFDEQNCSAQVAHTLAQKLPGFARIPGGLKYITDNAHVDDTDLFPLDLIMNYPVDPDAMDSAQKISYWLVSYPGFLETIFNRNGRYVITTSEVINAANMFCTEFALHVNMLIQKCIRGKLLWEVESDMYEWVVPEIWFIIIAQNLYRLKREFSYFFAKQLYDQNPNDQFRHTIMEFVIRKLADH